MFTVGNWQPHIGDPSVVGWFTVFSYYLGAALGFIYALKGWTRLDRAEARFRLILAGMILLLGVTKEFNVPGALTELGRMAVSAVGGYEFRRGPQAVVVGLTLLGIVLTIRWARRRPWFHDVWQRHAPEIICVAYLCSLVALRVISLHQVGAWLAVEIAGVRVNAIVELSGIYALVIIIVRRIVSSPAAPS